MNRYELKRLMLNKDYSQEDLAKRMNLSQATINDWLNGKAIIQKKHYKRLEYVFQIKINENVCIQS